MCVARVVAVTRACRFLALAFALSLPKPSVPDESDFCLCAYRDDPLVAKPGGSHEISRKCSSQLRFKTGYSRQLMEAEPAWLRSYRNPTVSPSDRQPGSYGQDPGRGCWLYSLHFSVTRVIVLIQLTSQVVPPSAEKACSVWISLEETDQMEKRTRMLRPR